MSNPISITFYVPGAAKTKGSFRPIISKSTGRVFLRPEKKNADWQTRVAGFAVQAMAGNQRIDEGPVFIELDFYFPRPKCHYGTGKNSINLKSTSPQLHVTRPDVDKLQRAVLDGLTGIVYRDDSQVVEIRARKNWMIAGHEGVTVKVRT